MRTFVDVRATISSLGGEELARNAVYSLMGHVAPLILFMVSLPLFISHLGAEGYGVWVGINSVVGMMSILHFGLGEATIKYVSEYHGVGDRRRLQEIVGATILLYGLLAVVILLIGILVLPTVSGRIAEAFTRDPAIPHALRFATVAVAANVLTMVLAAVLKGVQRYDGPARVVLVRDVLRILGSLGLVSAGFGIVGMAVGTAAASVIGLGLAVGEVRRVLPHIRLRPTCVRWSLHRIFAFSVFSFVNALSTVAKTNGAILLIVRVLGAANGAYFSVPFQLYSQMVSIFGSATSVLFPAFSYIRAKDDDVRALRLFGSASRLVAWGASAAAAVALVLGPDLLRLWLGEEFSAAATMPFRLLLAFGAVVSMNTTAYFLLLGYGLIRLITTLHVVNAAMTLGLAVILVPRFGLLGAGLAFAADLIVCAYPVVALRLMRGHHRAKMLLRFYSPLIPCAAASLLASVVVSRLHLSGSQAMAFGGPLLLVTFVGAAALLGTLMGNKGLSTVEKSL